MSNRFKANVTQLEFLEATFYSARSVYNDSLVGFTIKHDLQKTGGTLIDASYTELLKVFEERATVPPYSLLSKTHKAVALEKLKELSVVLTDFINAGTKDLIWNVPYQTRHVESSCVFPSDTFKIIDDTLLIEGLTSPIYLGTKVEEASVQTVIVTRHGKGEYSFTLCQPEYMSSVGVTHG